MHSSSLLTRAATLSAIAAATVAVAACGSDDKTSGESGSAKPETIAITSAGTSKAQTFSAPATAKAGVARLTYTNNTPDSKGAEAQMAYVKGTHSDADIKAALANAMQSKAVPAWFEAAGGPSQTDSGKTTTIDQTMKAGTYYVLGGGDNPPAGKLAKITVSGNNGAKLPKTDGEVDASEYTFTSKGIAAGKPVLLANKGGQWHHFLAVQLAPGATAAQAKKFFLANGKGGGKPPIVGNPEKAALESTVMDPGFEQVVTAPKKPGKYVFFCFVSDKQGGPPHLMKGMIHEVDVN